MERETQNAALGTCRSQGGVLTPILMWVDIMRREQARTFGYAIIKPC